MGRPDSIVLTARGLLPLPCWDVRSVGITPTGTSGRPAINQAGLINTKGFLNVIFLSVVLTTPDLGSAVLSIAALSFLGLGDRPQAAE